MAFFGAMLLALIFLCVGSAFRSNLGNSLNSAADWIQTWAPYSYGAIVIVMMIPAVAFGLLAFGPKKEDAAAADIRYKESRVIHD